MKCGFEWHFQLNTGKLFCRDKSEIYDESIKRIERKFNPSISEFGEIDESARFEIEKGRRVIYEVCPNDCLVDIDEEPPHEVDKEALQIALNVARALNCYVFDKLIVMRKIILDGSVPSGFQRTILVGVDGEFEFGNEKIPIKSVCLEEDSGRKVGEEDGKPIYRLDRLGIPLIEVTTGVIETTPEKAKEIAMKFGLFTRLFNVRRGIGTIRQDVNLSTEGSERVEIKGFQDLRKMDKIIREEISRHENLIKLEKEKGYLVEKLNDEVKDITNLFANTNSNMIKGMLSEGKKVWGMKLEGFKGVLGYKVQTNKRFGGEIADYLKAKFGVSIIHSDELPAYGISQEEKDKISKEMGCKEEDAFLFFITDKNEKEIAKAIVERIRTLLTSVPSEVRFVDEKTETTKYLRPIGGKERMYIETDLPLIEISEEMKRIAEQYKGLNVDKLASKLNTSVEKLEIIIDEGKLGKAMSLYEKGIDINTFIKVFVEGANYVKNKYNKEINETFLEKLAKLLVEKRIANDAIRIILDKYSGENDPETIIEKNKLWKMKEEELEKIVSELKDLPIDRIITTIKARHGAVVDSEDILKVLKKING